MFGVVGALEAELPVRGLLAIRPSGCDPAGGSGQKVGGQRARAARGPGGCLRRHERKQTVVLMERPVEIVPWASENKDSFLPPVCALLMHREQL